jgi:alpha-1,2-mannosyltransferase
VGRGADDVDGTDRLDVAVPKPSSPATADTQADSSTTASAPAEPVRQHGRRLYGWHGPGMVRRALDGGRRAPLAAVLAVLLVLVVIGPMLWVRLYAKADLRLVDLAVYRSAGQSLLHGRPLYGYLTPVPQLLPFTYPPFSALVALLLAAIPARAANWVWTLGSLAVLGWLVLVAFRPLVRRFPVAQRPLVVAAALGAMAWTLPVRDCFRFGQVGIFLAALCVLDCVLPKTRWPRGMLIGIAAAIKLVPGVFIPYLWLTGRRRAAVVATAWFAGLNVATVIAIPQASKDYWTGALFDSNRLGNNANTSNQSLRGIVMRLFPGTVGSMLWVVAVVIVAIVGYRWARSASLSGYEVRAVAIVGLLSVLISPVSWIHHLAGWVPIAIGVVLGNGRDRRRVMYAVLGTVFFSLEVPWWGNSIVNEYAHFHVPGRLLQDAFGFGVLFAIWLLGRMESPSRVRMSAIADAEPVSR